MFEPVLILQRHQCAKILTRKAKDSTVLAPHSEFYKPLQTNSQLSKPLFNEIWIICGFSDGSLCGFVIVAVPFSSCISC